MSNMTLKYPRGQDVTAVSRIFDMAMRRTTKALSKSNCRTVIWRFGITCAPFLYEILQQFPVNLVLRAFLKYRAFDKHSRRFIFYAHVYGNLKRNSLCGTFSAQSESEPSVQSRTTCPVPRSSDCLRSRCPCSQLVISTHGLIQWVGVEHI
jgi:hypothetical protein